MGILDGMRCLPSPLNGYNQTDVQEKTPTASASGKGTVYRHFGNKEALFLAAVAHARDKLIAAGRCQSKEDRRSRDSAAPNAGLHHRHPTASSTIIPKSSN